MKEYFEEETMFDYLMEGFQVVGFDWRYLYVNQAVVRQSKYAAKEDLLGFTMMEKFPGIEKTELFKILMECMKERVMKNMENEFEFPDKTKGWFELRIRPVPKGIFILSMDITERKRGDKLREEHMEALEEMIFMTSHRVRQPISNIMGVSNLLKDPQITMSEVGKIVGYMNESVRALDKFTRELMEFIHEQKLKV